MRSRTIFCLSLLAILVAPFGLSLAQDPPAKKAEDRQTWRTAPRHASGIAPDPVAFADTAIVQVMAAPTYGWRGYFAVHPWIITKRSGETAYRRYDVVGWGGGKVVRQNYALPDGLWFGSTPEVLADHRGDEVDAMIDEIEAAVASYPYPDQYRSYPGPNSNTFIAHIGREVPSLTLDMPANAIGKDYRGATNPVGLSPSGTGVQANLFGLLGLTAGVEEGLEFNVLGLNFGIDFNRPALRLPSVGRLGMDNIPDHQDDKTGTAEAAEM
ncbi:MAG: DUF3750 domain-containing protein [Pseudomonadota bacterium]